MATRRRVGAGFYVLLFVATVLTFAVHEAGHWAVAEALGHDAYYGLNSAGVRGGDVPADHALMVRAAGPAVTAAQALLALGLVLGRNSLAAYAFLFSATFMRFLAAAMTPIHPNDEARIGLDLGWGPWPLPLLTVAVLIALTWIGARRLGLGWKVNLAAWLVAGAAVAAVVGMDAALKG